jgi:hypothetical protein
METALQINLDELKALLSHCKLEEKPNNGKLLRLRRKNPVKWVKTSLYHKMFIFLRKESLLSRKCIKREMHPER